MSGGVHQDGGHCLEERGIQRFVSPLQSGPRTLQAQDVRPDATMVHEADMG